MQRREFVCESYRFVPDTGTLSLHYTFDGGPRFEERIALPLATRSLSGVEAAALDRVFRLLLLACGVSYYKAFAPERIRCAAFALDAATAAFFTEFYINGLGEFAWRNGIDLARLNFAVEAVEPPSAVRLRLPRLACVPVGGGKDSIVTIECLKQADEPLVLFELGNAGPIEATITQAGLPAKLRYTDKTDFGPPWQCYGSHRPRSCFSRQLSGRAVWSPRSPLGLERRATLVVICLKVDVPKK